MSTPSISHYLSQYDKWEYNVPLKSQWLLFIDNLPDANLIQQINTYDGNWRIDAAALDTVLKRDVQTDRGNFFIDKAIIISDGSTEKHATIGGEGGFISAPAGGRRKDFGRLATNFRETNVDFIEAVIRPWITLTSYFGLFAYEGINNFPNLKTNITLYSFARYNTLNPVLRKVYRFYNAVPVEIDSSTYTYNEDNGTPDTRSIGWTFDKYGVEIVNEAIQVPATNTIATAAQLGAAVPTTLALPAAPQNQPLNIATPITRVTGINTFLP